VGSNPFVALFGCFQTFMLANCFLINCKGSILQELPLRFLLIRHECLFLYC
jgi:hypothetical protein